MRLTSTWQALGVLLVVLFGLWLAGPNAFERPSEANGETNGTPSWWGIQDQINLGLDLQGGVDATLEVDLDGAVARSLDTARIWATAVAAEENIRLFEAGAEAGRLLLQPRRASRFDAALAALRGNDDGPLIIIETASVDGQPAIALSLPESEAEAIRANAYTRTLEVLTRRIDAFGVSEASIRAQAPNRVIVQLPGADSFDPSFLTPARLEFFLRFDSQSTGLSRNLLPHPLGSVDAADTPIEDSAPCITGDDLDRVGVSSHPQTGIPLVSITLAGQGALAFGRCTGPNVGRNLVVALDERVLFDGTIRDRLSTSFVLEGAFSADEAARLATLIGSGALPADVTIVQQSTVGPQLGAENIQAGAFAALLGLLLVVLFMVTIYRSFGVFAALALSINLVLVVAVLTLFGATLTLPGMAGLVLTLGIAVDTNVLVFERMREVLRQNGRLRQSISAGYEQALSTILDANLTTLIAATLLYTFGSGAVRGFAVTLGIGILTSMFAGLILTRVLIGLWFGTGRTRLPLRLTGILGRETRFNFLAFRQIGLVLSAVILLGSLALVGLRGFNSGIDFRGGINIQIRFDGTPDLDSLRSEIESYGFGSATVQAYGAPDTALVALAAASDDAKSILDTIKTRLLAGGLFVLEAGEGERLSDAQSALTAAGYAPQAEQEALTLTLPERPFERAAPAAPTALAQERDAIKAVLREAGLPLTAASLRTSPQILEDRVVTASITAKFRSDAITAVVLALLAIAVYIGFRFQWRFAIAALIALVHDVVSTLGLLALSQIELNLSLVAAVLTTAGYSINDTVVVFDRAREELRRGGTASNQAILNLALNRTFSRTIMTSLTTLLALLALLSFGGEALRGLSIALIWGVVIGTYSSLFLATPLLLLFKVSPKLFAPREAGEDAGEDAALRFAQTIQEEPEILPPEPSSTVPTAPAAPKPPRKSSNAKRNAARKNRKKRSR